MLKRVCACAVVWAIFGQAAYSQDLLNEYGDLMVGRWVGQVKLIADWPGIGKQGEDVVAHLTIKWTADGKGLDEEWVGGNGTGRSIYAFDPETKKIRQFGVDSGGTTSDYLTWKEGEKWVFEGGGYLADGKKFHGEGTVKISDDGQAFVYVGTFTMDGKKLSDLHDVYKRASR